MVKNKTIFYKPKNRFTFDASHITRLKRKALFIINPISGGKAKDGIPALIGKGIDTSIFDFSIEFTEGAEHATMLGKKAVDEKYDLVVAVGGDGTINEVASALVNTDVTFGIIPSGSGNGLSRFLDVPMDIEEAIRHLNTGRYEVIDTATANNQHFFNMAGFGFDAHIAEVFSKQKARGFFTYAKSAFGEIVKYKPRNYRFSIDGKKYERSAFMLSLANSSQYGNNAHVSPKASVQDGLLDVCIIKPFSIWRFPEMAIRMFTKTTDRSEFVEIVRGKHIVVSQLQPGPMHLDGEPFMITEDVEINVIPRSLKIIVGDNYRP